MSVSHKTSVYAPFEETLESVRDMGYLHRVYLDQSSSTGKSSIQRMFTDKIFTQHTETTVGVDMCSKNVQLHGKQLRLCVWDTAGQEKYLSISRSYYKGADGCLLVYDITSRRSFDMVPMWLSEARANTGNPNLVVLMIGNKADLDTMREVPRSSAEEFAEANNLKFMELSAMNYQSVEEAFIATAATIYEQNGIGLRAVKNGLQVGGKKEQQPSSASTRCCK